MYKIDLSKLGKVETVKDDLTARYGEIGTESRIEFDAKAQAWYLAECLKEARRKAGMTQAQLAEVIGKKRTYVSLIEQGKTDMQRSTFIKISEALGLKLSVCYA